MTVIDAPARTDAGLNSLGFAKPPSETRVVAAMSGGVDSSVVAAMLAREGYDVIGVTLQLYDHGAALKKKGACCAGQDIHDARRVAESCGIPHYVLDYENRFKDSVMEDFADTYLAGATPIPCVRCNQKVKFKDLLETARDLGADCMATGHYVQRVMSETGQAELHRGADDSRDQSYFLFTTTQDQLDYLRFPLGGLEKDRVRELAAEFGLRVAAKPDSQDICFVPQGRYTDVVEKLRPGAAEPGEIVHVDGRVLGEHPGVINYTVGQRRGLGVSTGEPLFVIRLEAEARRVIVGPREALGVRRIGVTDINWLDGVADADSLDGRPVLVRVRSTRPPVPAKLARSNSAPLAVVLDEGEEGVAPGQAAVFYDADDPMRVLGGGWISGTENS